MMLGWHLSIALTTSAAFTEGLGSPTAPPGPLARHPSTFSAPPTSLGPAPAGLVAPWHSPHQAAAGTVGAAPRPRAVGHDEPAAHLPPPLRTLRRWPKPLVRHLAQGFCVLPLAWAMLAPAEVKRKRTSGSLKPRTLPKTPSRQSKSNARRLSWTRAPLVSETGSILRYQGPVPGESSGAAPEQTPKGFHPDLDAWAVSEAPGAAATAAWAAHRARSLAPRGPPCSRGRRRCRS